MTAAETSLRDTGAMADPRAFEYDLIQALAYELANARRDHTVLSGRYGGAHPEAIKADAVVWALTTRDQRRSPPRQIGDLSPVLLPPVGGFPHPS